jgi:hypothetical protein
LEVWKKVWNNNNNNNNGKLIIFSLITSFHVPGGGRGGFRILSSFVIIRQWSFVLALIKLFFFLKGLSHEIDFKCSARTRAE